jgi:hypothetical protein
MKLLHYIHPSKTHFLATVKYINGEEREFDYVIGMYKSNSMYTKLIGIENKEIVKLNNQEFKNIIFTSNKKDDV